MNTATYPKITVPVEFEIINRRNWKSGGIMMTPLGAPIQRNGKEVGYVAASHSGEPVVTIDDSDSILRGDPNKIYDAIYAAVKRAEKEGLIPDGYDPLATLKL